MATTLQYLINNTSKGSVYRLQLELQKKLADFVIQLKEEKESYILLLRGNREVTQLVQQIFDDAHITYNQLELEPQLVTL